MTQRKEDVTDDSLKPVLPVDSQSSSFSSDPARQRRSENQVMTQRKEDGTDDSLKPVLPVDSQSSSFSSDPAQHTKGTTIEDEASNTNNPYDLYCEVLDAAEEYFPDEVFLDDAWLCSEVLSDSPRNQDPNSGLVRATLESLLRPFYEKTERAGEDQMQVVRVRRKHIWSDALRAFAKVDFKAGVLLSVHFIGEEAVDMGGPRRELLRLLMRSLATESGILTGSKKRMFFSSSPLLVAQRTYFHAGRMVATSILQGGPGLKCLSPAVYAYLLDNFDKCRRLVSVEDIPDVELREKVKQIQSFSQDGFEEGMHEVTDFLLDLGITKVKWNFGEKAALVQMICEHLTINRSKVALDQFVDGLKNVDMDFFESVKAESLVFEKVFCFVEEVLTPTDFRHLFNPYFSPIGANGRGGEELTCLWWEELIDQQTIPLTKILEFCTVDEIPPLGFDRTIDIMFFDQMPGVRRFPYASTCALQIYFPRTVESYAEFEELMIQAISGTFGFEKI